MRTGDPLRVLDFLFVLRPLILIPAWSFYVLGYAEGAGSAGAMDAGSPVRAVLLCLTAILITTYLLNQVFDRDSDEKNGKCLYLARGVFRARTLVGLAMASFLVASISFRHVAPAQRPLLLTALTLSLFYSLPPLRLCARPFVDLAANAIGYGAVAFLLGYGLSTGQFFDGLLRSLPYVLLVGATFMHTAILDVEGDRATGKTTTAVFVGVRASHRLAIALHTLAIAAAAAVENWPALAVTTAALSTTAWAALSPASKKHGHGITPTASALVVQVNTLVVTLAAAVFWPPYAVPIVAMVVISRFYHKRRFGITYPGLQKSA